MLFRHIFVFFCLLKTCGWNANPRSADETYFTTRNKTSQLPSFLFALIGHVRPTKKRHFYHGTSTRTASLTPTNTSRSNFKHATMKIVCYCWFGTRLPSVKPTDTGQLHFSKNNILHYCHCLFTRICVCEFFFSSFSYKQKKSWKRNWKSSPVKTPTPSYYKSRASDTCCWTLNSNFKPRTRRASELIGFKEFPSSRKNFLSMENVYSFPRGRTFSDTESIIACCTWWRCQLNQNGKPVIASNINVFRFILITKWNGVHICTTLHNALLHA